MLQQLSVTNYALIDSLGIQFNSGLTTITGETGAGKSILLGALGLIIGQRADTQALRDKSAKCVVEGTFNIKAYHLKSFFERNDLDYSDTTIIRREISAAGNSRAFINDTPVTLNQLRELGLALVDIHSQHETLAVNQAAYQFSVIDAFAQNDKLLNHYLTIYKEYNKKLKTLADLEEKEKQSKLDEDYFQFLFEELDKAALQPDELGAAEEELQTLTHAEEIKASLGKAFNALSEGEVNILSQLNEARALLNGVCKYNTGIEKLAERLQSAFIELKDISAEIDSVAEETGYDPERIEYLNQRVNLLNNLLHKHRVSETEKLVEIRDDLEQKLQSIASLDEEISKAKEELGALHEKLVKSASDITESRLKSKSLLEQEIISVLRQLNMPDAQLRVEISSAPDFNETGKDKIQFLFSANKGGSLKELGKVASGGELSRLMLAVKAVVSKVKALPSIIFDEIDTGVSGEVAGKIAGIMAQMAKTMQVITITHLPQIASRGNDHLFVFKTTDKEQTRSSIKKLNNNERIEEIAHMLSGEQLSKAALENAKELLKVS